MENKPKGYKIRIQKKDDKIIRVLLDDVDLMGVVGVEINSKYNTKDTQESIKIELTNIDLLELIGD